MRYVAAPALRSRARSASIVRGWISPHFRCDRHPRGAVESPGRSRSVVVGRDPVVEEVPPPAQRRRLAGLGQVDAVGQRRVGDLGGVVELEPAGPGRGVDRAAPAVVGPGPRERREDAVGLTRAAGHPARARRRTASRCGPGRSPCSARACSTAASRRLAVGPEVGRDVDPLGADRPRGQHHPAYGVAADHRQPGLPLPERGVEGAQRGARGRRDGPGRPGPTAPGRARTGAAPSPSAHGLDQGRVVREAEVAAEPHDGRHRAPPCQPLRPCVTMSA